MRGNVVWALGDQAIVSLGAFGLQVLAGRALTAAEFGTFALLYGLMMAAYIVNGALVFYPLTLEAAAAEREALSRLSGAAVVQAVVLAAPWIVALYGAAVYLGRPEVVPAAAGALLAWQAHEALRRMLMAVLRHRRASLGDGIVTTGHIAVVAFLAVTGRLTVTTAFLAMAANYTAAFLAQAMHLRPKVGQAGMRSLPANVRTGRWLFATEIAGIGITQLPPWALAIVSGPAAAGAFAAVLNVLKVSHPALYGIHNLIVAVVARERGRAGFRQARGAALRLGGVLAALVLPFYVIAALWPGFLLRLLYGPGSEYTAYAGAVPILVVAYCSYSGWMVAAAWLNGLEQSHLVLRSHVLAAVVGAIAIWPLALRQGVMGAAVTVAVMQVVATTALLYFAGRWHSTTLRRPAAEAVTGGT
jgi:O-antigen/teichoic acid export membrane protein